MEPQSAQSINHVAQIRKYFPIIIVTVVVLVAALAIVVVQRIRINNLPNTGTDNPIPTVPPTCDLVCADGHLDPNICSCVPDVTSIISTNTPILIMGNYLLKSMSVSLDQATGNNVITYKVQNDGTAEIAGNSFQNTYWINPVPEPSSINNIQPTQSLFQAKILTSQRLSAGTSGLGTISINNSSIPAGVYKLCMWYDSSKAVNEANENDNILCSQVTLAIPEAPACTSFTNMWINDCNSTGLLGTPQCATTSDKATIHYNSNAASMKFLDATSMPGILCSAIPDSTFTGQSQIYDANNPTINWTLTPGFGLKKICVRFENSAGSSKCGGTINYTGVTPVVTNTAIPVSPPQCTSFQNMWIEGCQSWNAADPTANASCITNNTNVQINLNSSNATTMRFYEKTANLDIACSALDPGAFPVVFQSYYPTHNITLSSTPGEKQVCVSLGNSAGSSQCGGKIWFQPSITPTISTIPSPTPTPQGAPECTSFVNMWLENCKTNQMTGPDCTINTNKLNINLAVPNITAGSKMSFYEKTAADDPKVLCNSIDPNKFSTPVDYATQVKDYQLQATTGQVKVCVRLVNSSGAASQCGGGINIVEPVYRILKVESGAVVTLSGLTLMGGRADIGAAIENFSFLEINNSIIANNIADVYGGGIYNEGYLSVRNSIFHANSIGNTNGAGGAIYSRNTNGGSYLQNSLTISKTMFEGNIAGTGGGGAIYSEDTPVMISRSSFKLNLAPSGGALYLTAIRSNDILNRIDNSTFASNTSMYGVINNTGSSKHVRLDLMFSTFVSDLPSSANNFTLYSGTNSEINFRNNILAAKGATQCNSIPNSLGGNVIIDSSCTVLPVSNNDIVGTQVNPLLSAEQTIPGNKTVFFSIDQSSPAFNNAINCTGTPIDQLEQTRPQGSACDSGAYEFPIPVTTTVTPTPATVAMTCSEGFTDDFGRFMIDSSRWKVNIADSLKTSVEINAQGGMLLIHIKKDNLNFDTTPNVQLQRWITGNFNVEVDMLQWQTPLPLDKKDTAVAAFQIVDNTGYVRKIWFEAATLSDGVTIDPNNYLLASDSYKFKILVPRYGSVRLKAIKTGEEISYFYTVLNRNDGSTTTGFIGKDTGVKGVNVMPIMKMSSPLANTFEFDNFTLNCDQAVPVCTSFQNMWIEGCQSWNAADPTANASCITNNANVQIHLNSPNASQMQFYEKTANLNIPCSALDPGTFPPEQYYSSTQNITLSSTPGEKQVCVRLTNSNGSSQCGGKIWFQPSITPTISTIPSPTPTPQGAPQCTSFVNMWLENCKTNQMTGPACTINTNKLNINLAVPNITAGSMMSFYERTAADDPKALCSSFDPNKFSTPVDYATQVKDYQLQATTGQVKVCVRLVNGSGAASQCGGGINIVEPVYRILQTAVNTNVTLSGITLQGGRADGVGGATMGGAIANYGIMNLNNSILTNNSAVSSGGAIYNEGMLRINASRIFANTTKGTGIGGGGAIYNNGTQLNISTSALNSNQSGSAGGGAILSRGSEVNILKSSFKDNITTGSGGALNFFNDHASILKNIIINSTFADNSVQSGEIYSNASYQYSLVTNISFSTFTSKSSGSNTLGTTLFATGKSEMFIKNNIIADNRTTQCNSPLLIDSSGGNVVLDRSCLQDPNNLNGDIIQNPKLQVEASNVNYYSVAYPIDLTSPAVDAVKDCMDLDITTIVEDQWGRVRPNGSLCDSGAYEFLMDVTPTISTIPSPTPTPVGAPACTSFVNMWIENCNDSQVPAGLCTVYKNHVTIHLNTTNASMMSFYERTAADDVNALCSSFDPTKFSPRVNYASQVDNFLLHATPGKVKVCVRFENSNGAASQCGGVIILGDAIPTVTPSVTPVQPSNTVMPSATAGVQNSNTPTPIRPSNTASVPTNTRPVVYYSATPRPTTNGIVTPTITGTITITPSGSITVTPTIKVTVTNTGTVTPTTTNGGGILGNFDFGTFFSDLLSGKASPWGYLGVALCCLFWLILLLLLVGLLRRRKDENGANAMFTNQI
ncbi:MAG: choice-of-anchor Q domain-containing protein [bacterium]